MKKISDPQYLRVALALEPRMMFDAAAVTTAAEVVATQAATDAPTVTATPAVDSVYTIDEHGVAGADAPLFSAVTVAADAAGDEVTKLVVTVSTSGADQALVVDGSTIALTATGNSETENHFYTYNVAVADGKAT
ncbi:LEPR-XLL domain-containing protein, partial [Lonsdalea britannica]|uniref:LEPR-XLL domain-containing protein n=1 Tax=Lonsdalea britannica TaxID=1082704 RepID=UPI0026EA7650